MVDESRDKSKKDQVAIVLRFVDAKGMIQEKLLDLVHVTDTLSATLKTSLWKQLSHYQLDVKKIRGQGYDGASNMRGEWNGLQILLCLLRFCFASREVIPIHKFFNKLVFTIKVVCASSKRHDELLSLIDMLGATRAVLQGIVEDLSHTTFFQRGDADTTCDYLESFEFVFILHLMKEVLGKTETLSQALQKKSQDIPNAMELVSSRKANLNEFRNNGWEFFLSKVTFLCQVSHTNARYERFVYFYSISAS
ncbi:uncharacterized protein LOC143531448 [Bidens hawaiensis]|uniref:uncharacterized protein LOC143531448 n=1 Tax=Bidens hawaiensis TaxID=980011 RepID=UPI00404A53CC